MLTPNYHTCEPGLSGIHNNGLEVRDATNFRSRLFALNLVPHCDGKEKGRLAEFPTRGSDETTMRNISMERGVPECLRGECIVAESEQVLDRLLT